MNFDELLIKLGYKTKCKNCGAIHSFRWFFIVSLISLAITVPLVIWGVTYDIPQTTLHNECAALELNISEKMCGYKNGIVGGIGNSSNSYDFNFSNNSG